MSKKHKVIDYVLYFMYAFVVAMAVYLMYEFDGMRKERILNWARENNLEICKIEYANVIDAARHNIWEEKGSFIYRIETNKGIFYSKNGLYFVKDNQ